MKTSFCKAKPYIVNPPGNEATPGQFEKQGMEVSSVCAKESHYFHTVSCPLSHDPSKGWGQGPWQVQGESCIMSHTTLPQVAAPHKMFVTFYTTHAQCMLHPHISCEGASNNVKVMRLMSCMDRDDSELSVIFLTNRTRDD